MLDIRIKLNLPDGAWENNDGVEPEGTRLLTTILLNGVLMHLEAWEVYIDDAGVQQHPTHPEDLDKLTDLMGADSPFHTWEINGRRYIVIATPFCT